MAIQFIQTDFAGQSGVNPRLVRLVCDDDYATVTTENYLQEAERLGYPIKPTDFIFCIYGTGQAQMFVPIITSSSITLSAWPAQVSNIQLKSQIYSENLTWTGGGLNHDFSIPGATSTSVLSPRISESDNTSYIASAKVNTPGVVTVQFSADPGNVKIAFVVFFNPQT